MTDIDEVKWELENQLGILDGKLDEIERRQMHANARIRRELAGTVIISGVTLIAVCMMWAGAEWRWWYVVVLGLGLPMYFGIEGSRAMEQEEPK